MTSKFTEAQFDKAGFLGLIKEFLNKVDELAPTGKTTGSKSSNLEKAKF